VLEGELTLLVDGVEHVLGEDRVVRVGPAVRRQLVNAGAQRLVLLALGGSGGHVGRDGRAWTSWDDDGPGAPPQEIPMPEDLPTV
jgi:mannose-6-phosphate isomerase-like protein (cupin superfamily)